MSSKKSRLCLASLNLIVSIHAFTGSAPHLSLPVALESRRASAAASIASVASEVRVDEDDLRFAGSMPMPAAAAAAADADDPRPGAVPTLAGGSRLAEFGALLSLREEELIALLGGSGRARIAWAALKHGLDPTVHSTQATSAADADPHVPNARIVPSPLGAAAKEELSKRLALRPPVVHTVASPDGTRKLLLRLSDGLEVEAVLIPHYGRDDAAAAAGAKEEKGGGGGGGAEAAAAGHTTLCVSSQVGCARGCAFCRTGAMGLLRCLSAEEILAQVLEGRSLARLEGMPPLNNVVFMGMGEPLNNPKEVARAVEVLTRDVFGFGFAKTKVTVSTVGPSPLAIRAAAALPAMLAWSVHAARDDKRRALVTTTRHSMVELREAFRQALATRSKQMRILMVEVTMLAGVNDSVEDATDLAAFLEPMINDDGSKVMVNLIPYNDIGHPEFDRSPPQQVAAFQAELRRRGVFAFVRVTHGDGELSACGQLATAPKKAEPRQSQGISKA